MEPEKQTALDKKQFDVLSEAHEYVFGGADPVVLFCIRLDARLPVIGEDSALLVDARPL